MENIVAFDRKGREVSVPHWGSVMTCNKIDKNLFPVVERTQFGTVNVQGVLENIQFLMECYGIDCRYNMVTKSVEIKIPFENSTPDNRDNCAVNVITSLCIMNKVPIGQLDGFITKLADDNAFNPVLEWIKSRPWDGFDRMRQVCDGVSVPREYEAMRDIFIRKWCMCSVGMLENTGSLDYEGILVFQGEQGLGKTAWFKRISGQMSKYCTDGLVLDPHDKDTVLTAVGHWMVELGEIDATFKKNEIAALKAFFTKRTDKIRRPYDRRDSILPRRTTFFASVNRKDFLSDDTGNRRFWCLPVSALVLPDDFDAQQFWAQVMVELDGAGGADTKPWYLRGDEIHMRNYANVDFTEEDPNESMLITKFGRNGAGRALIKATAVQAARFIGLQPNRPNTSAVGRAMTRLYGKATRTAESRYYVVPCPKGITDMEMQQYGFERVEESK